MSVFVDGITSYNENIRVCLQKRHHIGKTEIECRREIQFHDKLNLLNRQFSLLLQNIDGVNNELHHRSNGYHFDAINHVNLHSVFHRVQGLFVDAESKLFAENCTEFSQRYLVADVNQGEARKHGALAEFIVF